jgi:hypothetical protein
MIIKTSFSGYGFSALHDKGLHIYTQLLDNPNFETTTPTVAELKTALDNYQTALENATDSSKHNRIVRDNRRLDLIDCLKRLAKYLEYAANSNRELLSTTGFDLVRETKEVRPMTKVEDLKLKPLGSNNLSVTFKKLAAAKSYVIEYRETGTESWNVLATAVTRNTLSNLIPHVEYQARVYGVGKEKTILYSDIASTFVV